MSEALSRHFNLKNGICYLVAFFLSTWCFGKNMPGTSIAFFSLGTLLLFYLSPVFFLRKKLHLQHKLLFFLFIGLHLIVINPFAENDFTLLFMLKVLVSFVFFFILVNLLDDFESYSRMINVLLFWTFIIAVVLIYLHFFVFHSLYLTTHLTQSSLHYGGRGGKNTLSFFLASVFPFAYARFTHKKSLVSLALLSVIAFGILYTLSRMALISLVGSLFVPCLFSLKRASFIKQLLTVLMLVGFFTTLTGISIQTFLKLRNAVDIHTVERTERSFISLESHRMVLIKAALRGFMEKPLLGHGLATFRGQDVTGGSLSHNDYMQILYELGLVGFLTLLGIVLVSVIDLFKSQKNVPPDYLWLVDGQIGSVLASFGMLVFMNAYETAPVWFSLVGAQIIPFITRRKNEPPST